MQIPVEHAYASTIGEITSLAWDRLGEQECVDVAWAYYFFSVQFREHLEIARKLLPHDDKLIELEAGECQTDNLSPWPGVAQPGEKMNHDEFMRRTLTLAPIADAQQRSFIEQGERYLAATRAMDDATRAMSIASYEDGGLEAVFNAMLSMPQWPSPVLGAFRHFLAQHILFDSDPDAGHGALARHLQPDDRINPLWQMFRDLLRSFAPSLGAKETAAAA